MAHEDISRDQHVEGSSDRAFGLVFAAVFLIIAAWPVIRASPPRWWAGAAAVAFALVALTRPSLLAWLNRWWMKLGLLLGRIVSPIALGLLFYGVITPIGIVMRLAGKDPLLLKRDSAAASYWRHRDPPGPRPDSMNHQF
jgi:polyferredoxin